MIIYEIDHQLSWFDLDNKKEYISQMITVKTRCSENLHLFKQSLL